MSSGSLRGETGAAANSITEPCAHKAKDPYLAGKRAARSRKWSDALALFQSAEQGNLVPDHRARLMWAVADFWVRKAEDNAATLGHLDPTWITSEENAADFKRLLISPLIQQGSLSQGIAAQTLLVVALPHQMSEHFLLARYQGRSGDWAAAARTLDTIGSADHSDPEQSALAIKTYLQAGQWVKATCWARRAEHHVPSHTGLSHLILTALNRQSNFSDGARLSSLIDPVTVDDARLLGAMLTSYVGNRQFLIAIEKGECAVMAGKEGVALRLQLGRAYIESTGVRDARLKAVEHLQAAYQQDRNNLRVVSLLGEALMRAGRFSEAAEALAVAHGLRPESWQIQGLLARTLKHAGRHHEAATHFERLAKQGGVDHSWSRFAVGALLQAGRADDARRLYDEKLAERRAVLPTSLADGLLALWDKTDDAKVPQDRLDWAWAFADQGRYSGRAEWERRAKWGYLADHLLLDWLECRDDRIEDALYLLDDLNDAEQSLKAVNLSRGAVIATAHIGPLYAGPMILELLGLPSKWLASTPNLGGTSYSGSLISTSDRSETQVVKASLKALANGELISLALDGASSPVSPRILFEGQEVTYSSFAARITHRAGVPSIFYAPAWVGGKISVIVKPMPVVKQGEDVASFAGRWRKAYLHNLLEYLHGAPENLRLAGGIWRYVRMAPNVFNARR